MKTKRKTGIAAPPGGEQTATPPSRPVRVLVKGGATSPASGLVSVSAQPAVRPRHQFALALERALLQVRRKGLGLHSKQAGFQPQAPQKVNKQNVIIKKRQPDCGPRRMIRPAALFSPDARQPVDGAAHAVSKKARPEKNLTHMTETSPTPSFFTAHAPTSHGKATS